MQHYWMCSVLWGLNITVGEHRQYILGCSLLLVGGGYTSAVERHHQYRGGYLGIQLALLALPPRYWWYLNQYWTPSIVLMVSPTMIRAPLLSTDGILLEHWTPSRRDWNIQKSNFEKWYIHYHLLLLFVLSSLINSKIAISIYVSYPPSCSIEKSNSISIFY